jgi:hypothetical protein
MVQAMPSSGQTESTYHSRVGSGSTVPPSRVPESRMTARRRTRRFGIGVTFSYVAGGGEVSIRPPRLRI